MSNTTGQWESWNLRIKDKVWRNVRPLTLELIEETEEVVTRRFLFWTDTESVKTGQWIVRLGFDRGPLTHTAKDNVVFDNEADARKAFKHISSTVFLHVEIQGNIPPLPPAPKSKSTSKNKHLTLV